MGIISKHFNSGHVRQWIKDIGESKSLDWSADPKASGWTYECSFNSKEGKIVVGALKADMHRMSRENVGQLAYKFASMAKYIENVFLKKQAEQAIWKDQVQDDEDLVRYYERLGAADLAAELQKKVESAQGEPDPSHGRVVPRQEESIASVIQVQPLVSPTDAEPSEFDPMIDGGPKTPVSDNKARKGRSSR